MLPSSSSSQLPSYGPINQYKRFSWLMQTQLEKQADQSATALSLGNMGTSHRSQIPSSVTKERGSHGNVPSSVMKESKPAHVMKESKPWNVSSSRAEIVCANRALAMAVAESPARFACCVSTDMNPVFSYLMINGVPAPSLSLAMQYENALVSDPNFRNPRGPATIPPYNEQVSEMACKNDHGVNKFLQPALVQPSPCNVQSPTPLFAECESSVSSTAGDTKGQRGGGWELSCANELSLDGIDWTITHTGVRGHPCDLQSKDPSIVLHSADLAGSAKKLLSSSHGVLRMCTLCGTSKTPLWRSGPSGPKSLCNACGIRMKKSKMLQSDDADVAMAALCPTAKPFKRCTSSSKMAAGRSALPLKRKLSMEAAENLQNGGESSAIVCDQNKKRKAVPRRLRTWAPPNVAGSAGGQDGRAKLGAGLAGTAKSCAKMGCNANKVDELEEAAVLLMALSRGLTLS